MNKTLKTVLITLGAVFVFLIFIVWFFGDEPVTPSNDTSKDVIAETSMNDSQTSSKAAKISADVYAATIGYDVFDWNGASEQRKKEIVNTIVRIWNDGGNSTNMTTDELVGYINLNLGDQANVFEVACIAAQIDPLPYMNRTN